MSDRSAGVVSERPRGRLAVGPCATTGPARADIARRAGTRHSPDPPPWPLAIQSRRPESHAPRFLTSGFHCDLLRSHRNARTRPVGASHDCEALGTTRACLAMVGAPSGGLAAARDLAPAVQTSRWHTCAQRCASACCRGAPPAVHCRRRDRPKRRHRSSSCALAGCRPTTRLTGGRHCKTGGARIPHTHRRRGAHRTHAVRVAPGGP